MERTEIKNQSGKTLFTAEPDETRLNIKSATGKKLCCIEQDGSQLKVKDAEDRIMGQVDNQM